MKALLNVFKFLILIFSINIVFVWFVVLYATATGLLTIVLPEILFFPTDCLFNMIVKLSAYLYNTKITASEIRLYDILDIAVRLIILIDFINIYIKKRSISHENNKIKN